MPHRHPQSDAILSTLIASFFAGMTTLAAIYGVPHLSAIGGFCAGCFLTMAVAEVTDS